MSNQMGVLVMETERSPEISGIQTLRVYHMEMPELRGEGRSRSEACNALMQHLMNEVDRISDPWHRENVERIIVQVREFIQEEEQASASQSASEEWFGTRDDLA